MAIFDTIRGFRDRRAHRQAATQLGKQARFVLNSRGDLLDKKTTDDLLRIEGHCRLLLGDMMAKPGLDATSDELQAIVVRVMPKRSNPKMTENIEVAVVALSIALGFRTYFYQPFKIPTGSMEDTLSGIHVEQLASNSMAARLKYLKLGTWIIDGTYVKEVRAKTSGVVGDYITRGKNSRSGNYYVLIGGVQHKFPVQALDRQEVRLFPGQFVKKGELLWRGTIQAGDHVFVDKIRWNFGPPKRGQVVVFRTDGIPSLDQGIHYIKRLVGLPQETVTIRPPNVLINGITNGGCDEVGHVAEKPGYQTRVGSPREMPVTPLVTESGDHVYEVPTNSYFCLGDNSGSSLDSRYWGTVPRDNMVGPAVVVYWPFTKRWGSIRWPENPPGGIPGHTLE